VFIDVGLPLVFGCKPTKPKLAKSFFHLTIIPVSGILNFMLDSHRDIKSLSIAFNTFNLKAIE
jgi:hypothetical protein